jgi:arsenate reductase (glutaredoxin)
MAATIWHNPKCSTSRKVLARLQEAGLKPEVVEYLKTPPSRTKLKALIAAAGITPRGLLRKKEPAYRELKLDDPKLGDEALLDAMLKQPILIERPIVETERGARLCRPPELVDEILPKRR